MVSIYYEIVELLREDYDTGAIDKDTLVRTFKRLERSYPSMKGHMEKIMNNYGIYT